MYILHTKFSIAKDDVTTTSYRISLSLSICYKNKSIRNIVHGQEILINTSTRNLIGIH